MGGAKRRSMRGWSGARTGCGGTSLLRSRRQLDGASDPLIDPAPVFIIPIYRKMYYTCISFGKTPQRHRGLLIFMVKKHNLNFPT